MGKPRQHRAGGAFILDSLRTHEKTAGSGRVLVYEKLHEVACPTGKSKWILAEAGIW
jgi:hypothetical protein